MATPEQPRFEANTTPDVAGTTSTPQSFVSPEHSFSLQFIFELQKSMGQLTEAVRSLQGAIEKQGTRLDKFEEKLSGVTHKIYAAGVVLAILVVVGGFIVNKAWDLMVQQLNFKTETSSPAQSNQILPPKGSTKTP